jgi:YggT family protein
MSVDTVAAFVSWCFYIYTLFLLLHILLSWFQLPYNPLLNKVRGVLYDACQPYLNLFRGLLPPMGGLDLSPIIAFIVLYAANRIVVAVLLAFT